MLCAFEGPQPSSFFYPYEAPWFSGNLLAPSGFIAGYGQTSVQPYLSSFFRTAGYDSNWKVRSRPNLYSLDTFFDVQTGILPRMDFQVSTCIDYNSSEGAHSVGFGDIPITLNFQLYKPQNFATAPAIKLGFRFVAPTGRYQKLDSNKYGTQINGTGSWFPGPRIGMSKFFHLWGLHFIELRFGGDYRFGTITRVKGESIYGGDASTKGKVRPGNFYRVISGFQYNLTQNWGGSFDVLYAHYDRDRFYGKTKLPVGAPSGERISIAPAIQYNLSQKMGILGGIWMSVLGRNTSQFIAVSTSFSAAF